MSGIAAILRYPLQELDDIEEEDDEELDKQLNEENEEDEEEKDGEVVLSFD